MTGETLAGFLLARIAEDEAEARAASPGGWQFSTVASVGGGSLYDETRMIGEVHYEQLRDHDGQIVRHLLSPEADANGAHIARHDPARVLAECGAKRRIVEMGPARCPHGEPDEGDGSLPNHPHYPEPGWMNRPEWPTCESCIDCQSHDAAWRQAVRVLAAVYADHPDYREEWRP